MGDDQTRRPPASGSFPPARTPVDRDPRAALVVPVRVRYASFIEFIDTQSVNISRSGMFLATTNLLPVGTAVELELTLADDFPLLKGRAEVARVSTAPAGIGVRFRALDEPSKKLIDRIVEVNHEEGKRPVVPLDFATDTAADTGPLKGASAIHPGVSLSGGLLRIQVNPATASYFTANPLLNIRLGGFVIPSNEDVPLGTVFGLTIVDFPGQTLLVGRAKVVAKHERRLGMRIQDADRAALARLAAEIARLVPPAK